MAVVVAVIMGLVAAGIDDSAELEDAQTEIARLERRIDRLHDSNDDLVRDRDDAYAYADEIEAEVAAREAELDQRQAGLEARAADVDAQVAAAEANTFSDGIHQVGRDIQPGQYHTDGSAGGCYYALLTAPSGAGVDHIIDNNNIDGPATLVIDSAYFESSGGCQWTKIG